MNIQQLEIICGVRAAAKLTILRGRLQDDIAVADVVGADTLDMVEPILANFSYLCRNFLLDAAMEQRQIDTRLAAIYPS